MDHLVLFSYEVIINYKVISLDFPSSFLFQMKTFFVFALNKKILTLESELIHLIRKCGEVLVNTPSFET
jgi:hypothetical protein